MISRIDKYIFNRFIRFFIINFIIIVGVIWISRIIKYIDLITVKNIPLLDFIYITLLFLPKLIDFLLPLIVFITTIITINSFINSKELHIIRSSGYSNYKLLRPVMAIAVIVVVFNFSLSSYIAPYSYNLSEKIKIKLTNNFLTSLMKQGQKTNIGGYKVYVGDKDIDNRYNDFVLSNLNNNNEDVVIARQVEVINYRGRLLLNLINGKRIIINQNKITEGISFDNYLTDLSFFTDQEVKTDRKKNISGIYSHEFFDVIEQDFFKNEKLISEIIHRSLWPFLTFIFILYATAIICNGQYRRNGNAVNNVILILFSVFAISTFFTLKTLSSISIEFVMAMYGYIIIIMLIGVILNIKKKDIVK